MSGRDPNPDPNQGPNDPDPPDRSPPGDGPGRGPPDTPGRGPPEFVKARRAKQAVERTLRRKKHVHAVAVGRKVVRGKMTDEMSIIVHVTDKVPEDEVKEEDRIPRRIKVAGEGAVKTDVKESPIPTMDSTSVQPPRHTAHRPLVGGTQIAREGSGSWGTMGCILETAAGNIRLLTNRHVVSETDAGPTVGDNVVQPVNTAEVVGHVEEWSTLSTTESNTSDSALLSLATGITASNHFLTAGPMGPPTTVAVGDTCVILGARTYGKAAEVVELYYTGSVQSAEGNVYEYINLIRFEGSQGDSGDSGAIWGVYDDATNQLHPAGLHFAGGRLAIPWSALEDTHGELTPPSAASVSDWTSVATSDLTEIMPYELRTGDRAILRCIAARYGDPTAPTEETIELYDGPIVNGDPTGTVIGTKTIQSAWGVPTEIEFRGLEETLGTGTHTVTLASTYGSDEEYTIELVEPTEHRWYGTVTNTAGEVIADATVNAYRN